MSAVTADYDECTCIGGRCMRKEQSYASAFFTFWLVTVKVLNSYLFSIIYGISYLQNQVYF